MNSIDNLIITCESLIIPINIEKAKNFIRELIRKIKMLFDKIRRRELFLVEQDIYKRYMAIYDNLDRINIIRIKDEDDIDKIENGLKDLETEYNEFVDTRPKSENGR